MVSSDGHLSVVMSNGFVLILMYVSVLYSPLISYTLNVLFTPVPFETTQLTILTALQFCNTHLYKKHSTCHVVPLEDCSVSTVKPMLKDNPSYSRDTSCNCRQNILGLSHVCNIEVLLYTTNAGIITSLSQTDLESSLNTV